jgi:hypothetical protein
MNFLFIIYSICLFVRLNIDLIEKIDNDKHQIYSSSDAALKSILSKYLLSLFKISFWLGLTSDQYHSLETEKQNHPCDDYCEKV